MEPIQVNKLQLLKTVGPHGWWVYSALEALAVDGRCRVKLEDLAAQLGVSVASLKRYITKLTRIEVEGRPLVVISRTADSNIYQVAKVVSDPGEVVVKKPTTITDIWNYWMEKYEERYGTPYKPANWKREKALMKRLLEKYSGDTDRLKQIMDIVFRLYDTRWKTQRFTRPTIGQLCSWLAAQAEAYVSHQPATSSETPSNTDDLFDLIERKWGSADE